MSAHALSAALVLLLSTPAILATGATEAATIVVDVSGGGDFQTIQEGIDAAASGDTVLVLKGAYTGPYNRELDFAGRSIMLMSRDGAEQTVINCQGAGRAILFDDGESDESLVRGFTLTNGVSHPEDGAGVLVTNGSSPVIEDCVIESCNSSISYGGGIAVVSAEATLRRCEIRYCSGGGAAVHCDHGIVALENCEVRQNASGLHALFSTVRVESTLFRDNRHSDGRHFFLRYSGGTFSSCDFERSPEVNPGYYGAVRLYASSPVLEDCTFTLNYNTKAAIVYGLHSSPVFERCVFANNFSWGGAAIAQLGSTDIGDPVFRNCTLFGRIDWSDDNTIFALDDCWPLIENCILSFSGADQVLLVRGNSEPVLTHCVMYNVEGADELCGPGTVNALADPLFCDVYEYDFTLCENSPCLPEGNPWGELVGALDQGCSDCSSPVTRTSWGAIKAMYR